MGDEAQGGKIVYTVDYQVPEKEKKKMDFLIKQQPKLDRLYQSFSKSGAGAVATGAGLIGAAIMMVTAGSGFKSILGAMWDLFGLISDLVFIALWPILKPLLAAFIKAVRDGRLQWLIDALVFFGKVAIVFVIAGYVMFKMFKNAVSQFFRSVKVIWDAIVWFAQGVLWFINGIVGLISGFVGAIGNFVGGVGEFLGGVFGWIVEKLGGIWDTIVGAFQPLINAFNTLIGWIQDLINTLTGGGLSGLPGMPDAGRRSGEMQTVGGNSGRGWLDDIWDNTLGAVF